ncbi:MAG: transposase [Steroidobacteraceae bacterium]
MPRAIQSSPRGEQAWSEVVARQAASGLTVREFCRREGLSAWSLYEWRSRLRARSETRATPAARIAPCSPAPTPFIELGALERSRSRCEVRIELGGGVVLQVVRG